MRSIISLFSEAQKLPKVKADCKEDAFNEEPWLTKGCLSSVFVPQRAGRDVISDLEKMVKRK